MPIEKNTRRASGKDGARVVIAAMVPVKLRREIDKIADKENRARSKVIEMACRAWIEQQRAA